VFGRQGALDRDGQLPHFPPSAGWAPFVRRFCTQSGTFGNNWSTAFSQQYEWNRQSENQHGKHGKLDDELLRYARRFLVQPIEFCRQHQHASNGRNEPHKQERLGSEGVLVK
jgi:hypothetical protein